LNFNSKTIISALFTFLYNRRKSTSTPFYFVFILLLTTCNLYVSAQSQKDFIKIGDNLYNQGDYYGASKWYKKGVDLDSTFLDVVYKYAESLRMYNDYKKAQDRYYYVYKKDNGRTYSMAAFWYSTMLKYNGDYKNSKKFFKRSKRFFSRDKKGYYYQKIMQEIKACTYSLAHLKDTLPLDIKNIGNTLNTYDSDFGATLLNDSIMIYTSLRDEKMEDNYIVKDTSVYLLKLFKANRDGEVWLSDSVLEEKINEKGFHIANGCSNIKGDIFYYNKCDQQLNCKIFAIKYENGTWETPYEITAVNLEGYTATQPSITEIDSQEIMFFTSNRPEGKGKLDIWYSRNINGKFQSPANLGSKVNTIGNDITPFYYEKDTALYYSSDWTEGFGGFDVFKAKTNLLFFDKPENLGFPINTSVNDFYYSIKHNTALLSSNRKGSFTKKGETCCNDIYIYQLPELDTEIVYTSLEELNRYLPVTLFFHNDEPNPRTRDTITTQNYIDTYKSYTRLYGKYRKEYTYGLKGDAKEDALVDIEDLFTEYIEKGVSDLNQFTPLLIKELEKGKEITLTIKGFASPLSKSDYNVNLTLRRVSSLINYLSTYENGKLLPYINGTSDDGGKLNFIKVPFGEYQSVTNISDDIKDKRNSVYSPAAAFERKIEIIAISVNDTSNLAMDGSELEKLPLLTFKDTIITLKPGQLEKQIKIINNGEAPLEIYSAIFSCNGFSIELPKGEIPVLEPLYLTLKYNPTVDQPTNCTVTFLTNTIPNQIIKTISIE